MLDIFASFEHAGVTGHGANPIRAVDKTRLVKNLAAVPKVVADEIASVLIGMFQR
jgi:hypothetical protein